MASYGCSCSSSSFNGSSSPVLAFAVACSGYLVRYYFAFPYSFQKVMGLLSIVSFVALLVLTSWLVYTIARGRISLAYMLAGQPHLWVNYIILYCTIVLSYASIYPQIPYWAGGGKPRTVSLWVEAKSFPQPKRGRCGSDGDLLLCGGLFLVYENSEILIISEGDLPSSPYGAPQRRCKGVDQPRS